MRLLPETTPLDGVLLTWPHAGMDWQQHLPEVHANFIAIATAISHHSRVLIALHDAGDIPALRQQLNDHGANDQHIAIVPAPSNDVWARDHGPIAVDDHGRLRLLDFQFNGWGGKYPAHHDNRLSRTLATQKTFAADLLTLDMVLEGGSIDSNGELLLTTKACLLNPNRNAHLSQDDIEYRLRQWFGVKHIIWLEHGHLHGDDTDSHVDTIARLVGDTLIYQSCGDVRDPHFNSLNLLHLELQAVAESHALKLIGLPLPTAIFDADGERLPASYANFLIVNHTILLPTYGCAEDTEVLSILRQALPQYHIQPIDCRALVQQYGSLHCATMQLPKGTLNLDIFG